MTIKDEKHNFMQEECKAVKQYKASKQCKAINQNTIKGS